MHANTYLDETDSNLFELSDNYCPIHRPFRAHWRNYEDDHLEIVVDAHFTIPPTGNEYWDNRQSMLEAISHAAKKSGVRLERAVKQG